MMRFEYQIQSFENINIRFNFLINFESLIYVKIFIILNVKGKYISKNIEYLTFNNSWI